MKILVLPPLSEVRASLLQPGKGPDVARIQRRERSWERQEHYALSLRLIGQTQQGSWVTGA